MQVFSNGEICKSQVRNSILYEKSGLNLRNYMLHGTLINSTLDIPLMTTFSGLIFVSWLLNEK